MTLGDAVYQLVHDMIDTTIYSSAAGPDVDNYAKVIYQDPGLAQLIDVELQKLIPPTNQKATGGNGEFEDSLANEINDANNDEAELAMTDEEYANFMGNKTKDTVGLLGESQATSIVKQGVGIAKNPLMAIAPMISMMPHAALVLLAISLAPLIIDQLKSPGSALDIRWRRIMFEEFNAFMSRQDQWNAQIGLRQVYVQSSDGFMIGNGAAFSESNLRRVRESDQRIADRLEFTDHAKEFFK